MICGTVGSICVHYTAASAALRWYNVVIPRDAVSALDPFDLESSLRQTDFLFAGQVTTAAAIRPDCADSSKLGLRHGLPVIGNERLSQCPSSPGRSGAADGTSGSRLTRSRSVLGKSSPTHSSGCPATEATA
jgi:hypothetical protein